MSKHLEITVDSLDGVTHVDVKQVDADKGVSVLVAGDRIVQYLFDLENKEAAWTEETACAYIAKGKSAVCQSILAGTLEAMEAVKQVSAMSPEVFDKLKKVDSDPFIVPVRIAYGLGSNNQRFGREFFQNAGAKFVGTPFMLNHSDLAEFGKAIPVGSIVQFAGANEDHALFNVYISAAEQGLRQKIRESQALGDLGFVKKVSIEGIPARTDFTVEPKTGIKDFHDLTTPTGIAIVIKEGLSGSQIM